MSIERLLSPADLGRVTRIGRDRGITVERAAIALGLLTEDQILYLTAEEAGLPFVFPTEEGVDRDLLAAFPADLLRRLGALPLVRDEAGAVVAFAEPPDPETLELLAEHAGGPIRPVIAAPRRLLLLIDRVVRGGPVDAARVSAEDSSGMTAFYRHLAAVFGGGADELRFEPAGDAIRVRYRTAGRLVEAAREPAALAAGIVTRARMLSGLPSDDSRLVAESSFTTRIAGSDVRLTTTIVAAAGGHAVVLARAADRPAHPDLAAFGLPAEFAAWFRAEFLAAAGARPRRGGLVLAAAADRALLVEFGAAALAAIDPANAVAAASREPRLAPPDVLSAPFAPGAAAAVRAAAAAAPDVLVVDGGDAADGAREATAAALSGIRTLYLLADPIPEDAPETLHHAGVPPGRLARALAARIALSRGLDGALAIRTWLAAAGGR